jgi:hypothetical protein
LIADRRMVNALLRADISDNRRPGVDPNPGLNSPFSFTL